jgi:hypothetical protein
MSLLMGLYLFLELDGADAVGFRVDHLGICLIRVAISFCGSSRWGLGFFEMRPMVPKIVSSRKRLMVVLAYSRSSFSSSSVKASSSFMPDLWMLWYLCVVLVAVSC